MPSAIARTSAARCSYCCARLAHSSFVGTSKPNFAQGTLLPLPMVLQEPKLERSKACLKRVEGASWTMAKEGKRGAVVRGRPVVSDFGGLF